MTGLDAIRELNSLVAQLRQANVSMGREARDRREAGIEDSRLDSLYRWCALSDAIAARAEDAAGFCRDLDTGDVGSSGMAAIRKIQDIAAEKILCYVPWSIPATTE